MSWIFVAFLAYLFLVIANLFDKFLIDNVLPDSKTYTFISCLLSGLVFLAAPWFLQWPGTFWFSINILSGGIFVAALFTLYEALRRGEASRVLVLVGGLTPVFSVIFSLLFFKEHYTLAQWIGIVCLILGAIIIAFLPQQRNWLARVMAKLKITQNVKNSSLFLAIASAFFYSAYFLLTKYAYSTQPFTSAFLWSRLGAVFFVLLFLIKLKDRKTIIKTIKEPRKNKNNKFLVFVGQFFGATGFILQNYAISLGSVALVNAAQGMQYALLLIISTFLALTSPKLLKETFSWRIFLQKLLAVLIIGVGLYFIVI